MTEPADLMAKGLVQPSRTDWRVTLVFQDGSHRTIRVSPGNICEDQAVSKAMRHARVFDGSVLKETRIERAEPCTQVASFGTIQKKG